MRVQHASSLKKEKESKESGMLFKIVNIPSKVYDSPDLAENEATFAIGPQGIVNADG